MNLTEKTEKTQPNGSGAYVKKPYLISVKNYDSRIEHGILTENDSVEFLSGEIFEKMPKGTKHSYFNNVISDVLKEKLGKKTVIRNQNPILLDDFSEPGIVLCRLPREKYLSQHPTPEDILLIIEVSDTLWLLTGTTRVKPIRERALCNT